MLIIQSCCAFDLLLQANSANWSRETNQNKYER